MALRSLSTAELRRELTRRESALPKLNAEHARLSARLREVEAELSELGAAPPARRGRKPGRPKGSGKGKTGRKPGRPKGSGKGQSGRKPGRPKGSGRGRAKNTLSLPEAILKNVRPGAKVTPASVATTLKSSGFKSTSKTFGVMVSNALGKLPEFKRVGRGEYVRQGGKAAAPKAKGKTARRQATKAAPAGAAAAS